MAIIYKFLGKRRNILKKIIKIFSTFLKSYYMYTTHTEALYNSQHSKKKINISTTFGYIKKCIIHILPMAKSFTFFFVLSIKLLHFLSAFSLYHISNLFIYLLDPCSDKMESVEQCEYCIDLWI